MANLSRTDDSRLARFPVVIFICCLIFLGVLVLRIHFLPAPFERDEGEYAYGAQLLLQKAIPYKDFYSLKLPGIFVVYAALIAAFGPTITSVHVGLLLINVLNTLLIFLLARKLYDAKAALITSAAFSILACGLSVQGYFANSEQFAITPILLGFLLLMTAIQNKSAGLYVITGVFFSAGFIVKQHALLFSFVALIYLTLAHKRCLVSYSMTTVRDLFWFYFGLAIPYVIMIGVFIYLGAFKDLWFWTVAYAREYITVSNPSHATVFQQFKDSFLPILRENPCIWTCAGLGALSIVIPSQCKQNIFPVLLTVFSALAIMPGFYFRPHYFVFLLPAVALWVGVMVVWLSSVFEKMRIPAAAYVGSFVVSGSLLISLLLSFTRLLTTTPDQLNRQVYGTGLFSIIQTIAYYCEQRTQPNDRIGMFANEPELYFYAQRRGATGFLYTYPLFENHRYQPVMLKKLADEMTQQRPILLVDIDEHAADVFSPTRVYAVSAWTRPFIQKNYVRLTRVQLIEGGQIPLWNPSTTNPHAKDALTRDLTIDIYKRLPL